MTQSCDVSCHCRFQTFGISRSTTKILSAVHVTIARSSAGIVDSMHHETLGQLDGFAFMACWLHGHTLKTPILSNHILSICADHLTLQSLCLSNRAEYSLECFNLRLSAHSSLLGVRWQKATRSFHARNLVNLCDCTNNVTTKLLSLGFWQQSSFILA